MAHSWMDDRIEPRPSAIEGTGLWARKAIPSGTVVIVWRGKEVPLARLNELTARPRYSCAALTQDSMVVFEDDDPSNYGNHSCDPNLWMVSERAIATRREIKQDEELTIDYGTISDAPHWRMPCRCGASSCRGVITGEDWRITKLHDRYDAHFSPYLVVRWQDEAQARAEL